LLAEKKDGALRKHCAEEGLSTSMTASCDVLMPPRRDEEVFIAEGEEKREMLCDAAWIGAVGSSGPSHPRIMTFHEKITLFINISIIL